MIKEAGLNLAAAKRFERFVSPEPNAAGCWLWTGSTTRLGYGMFGSGGSGNMVSAHRASYWLFVGPIPQGAHVLHKCDVRCCVNPAHLFLGTHAENMDDMARKNRAGGTRLTPKDVYEIRASALSQRAIARQFAVSESNISLIRSGKIWRHVR